MSPCESVELLAPAGGWAQLRAALDAGADAVFFGAGSLNMRARAKNFTTDELADVCRLVHQKDAKAYLTLNTIIYEKDLVELEVLLNAARAAGVDAVIAADLAVIQRANAVGLPVHASTQLSVSNSISVGVLMHMGVQRFVMARECSLEDIALIQAHCGSGTSAPSIEVFAHGALCVAQSGRCFMSGFESGRSANRGECSQPCRREYEIRSDRGGEGFTLSGEHILSPKDLCTLPFLEKLLEAGVSALKIEGRNRSPDYVHTVVSVYREALDVYTAHSEEPGFWECFNELKSKGQVRLEKVFNRGFSSGFYMGTPLGEWTTFPGNQSSHVRDYIGRIIELHPERPEAILRLESSGLSAEETVFSESPESGVHVWSPENMVMEGVPVEQADKGSQVTLEKKTFMHKGLKIYRHQKKSDLSHHNR